MTTHCAPSLNGFLQVGDWLLAPAGGIIHQGERTAVIADLHLGYEWARGSAGDCIPVHSLRETLAKLDTMLQSGVVDRLIVAGDVVEAARPCARTAGELTRLARWLRERGVRLVLLRGNHDRGLDMMASLSPAVSDGSNLPLELQLRLDVACWTIAHGHLPTSARRLITGHHHPVLRVSGRSAPCFLAGECRIILPAFTKNAAGLDVSCARVPPSWQRYGLRCFASTGSEVLDFGPLETLSARLRSVAPSGLLLAPKEPSLVADSRLDPARKEA